MKRNVMLILASSLLICSGCAELAARSSGSGLEEFDIPIEESQVPELSLKQAHAISKQLIRHLDQSQGVAPRGSIYQTRLSRLTKGHLVAGSLVLSFRAYTNPLVSVLGLTDGSVRVFAGAMDLLDDNELLFVLANQVAHMKLGHSKRKLEVALAGIPGQIPQGGVLSASQLLAAQSGLQVARYSAEQETLADADAINFMKKNGYPPQAAVTALQKLGELSQRHSLSSGRAAAEDRISAIRPLLGGASSERMVRSSVKKEASSEIPMPQVPVSEERVEQNVPEMKSSEQEIEQRVQIPKEVEAVQKDTRVKTATLRRRREESATATAVEASPVETPPVHALKVEAPKVDPRPMETAPLGDSASRFAPGWYLQIAADTVEEDAIGRISKLKSLGVKGHIEQARVKGVQYYRVLVGPYATRDAAENDRPRIDLYGVAKGRPYPRKF